MFEVFIFCLVGIFAVWAFVMLRLTLVAPTRLWFIHNDPEFPKQYDALPSFDAMLFNPKYCLLWTVSHWQKWLERNNV